RFLGRSAPDGRTTFGRRSAPLVVRSSDSCISDPARATRSGQPRPAQRHRVRARRDDAVSSDDEVTVFGPYRLDRGGGRLVCGDANVPLRRKAFAVLEYLSARPGRLVASEELLDALWPTARAPRPPAASTSSGARSAMTPARHGSSKRRTAAAIASWRRRPAAAT